MLDSLVRLPFDPQQVGKIAMRLGRARIELQGPLEALDRFCCLALTRQDDAEVGVGARARGIDAERPTVLVDCARDVALSQQDVPEVDVRLRGIRLDRQGVRQQTGRLVQPSFSRQDIPELEIRRVEGRVARDGSVQRVDCACSLRPGRDTPATGRSTPRRRPGGRRRAPRSWPAGGPRTPSAGRRAELPSTHEHAHSGSSCARWPRTSAPAPASRPGGRRPRRAERSRP